ncbi:unnamed protein product [Psylliodes chrysocephalus]|uniref:Protein kinase domain-containing protein n=1 Tax=Psylliodes chrysocephalus TaxID=3402493 RepID=A0A9P0GC31_9CUCU|nr:unnamed protein product [Psylliodes chrysocephala]
MNPFQSKYRVLEKIGEGSFSDVLKCENRTTKICYAAKRLKKCYKSEANCQSCAEIVAAQKVPFHPNILNMLEYHFDSFSGKVTLIFELMDMSMHDYLKTKRRGLAENRVKCYLYQILRGLEHLHSHGLFHRDVKPENILIKFPSILYAPLSQTNSEEIIKLADLGSVRGIFSSPPYTEYISTRWYRSPECLLTVGNYGPKMDIWAAGCVFYEMLTLRPLFPGSNEIDQLCKIHHVLGSPNLQYLTRLKSRSRHCICFPKIKGTGTCGLLPYVSRHGRNVLDLMIEYDWEKRTNVKRLLKHCYFDDVRDALDVGLKSTFPNFWHQDSLNVINKSMGDDSNVSSSGPKKKILKREHYSDEARKSSNQTVRPKLFKNIGNEDSRRESKEGDSNRSENANKSSADSKKGRFTTNHEVPFYPRSGSQNRKLPLADFKSHRSTEKIQVSRDPIKRILRGKAVKDPSGRFLKATSNVEGRERKSITSESFRQLHSKSFVIPRNNVPPKSTKNMSETSPKNNYRESMHT